MPARSGKGHVEKEVESLVEVFESVDITLSAELKKALEVIDERFIQDSTKNKADYLLVLKELRAELEEIALRG